MWRTIWIESAVVRSRVRAQRRRRLAEGRPLTVVRESRAGSQSAWRNQRACAERHCHSDHLQEFAGA
jgi:hypothetical protein